MKKIYVIYASIPSLLFDNKIHDFIHDPMRYKLSDNKYIGLYAWTTKKKLLDEFLNTRYKARSMYTVLKKELDDDDYIYFKKDNNQEKLSCYKLYHDIVEEDENKNVHEKLNDETPRIVCTKNEYETIYDLGEQYLFDYMCQIVNFEYLVLNDQYKLLLDKIGYCDLFNRIFDGLTDYDDYDDFYHDRHEMTEFNNGYGLSYYGNTAVDICKNRLMIFINIFYEMIVGYDPEKEIKLLIYR
jgi:hypothetical protein